MKKKQVDSSLNSVFGLPNIGTSTAKDVFSKINNKKRSCTNEVSNPISTKGQSSWITSVGIDDDNHFFQIEMKDGHGGIYQYDCKGQEEKILQGVLGASSKGRYYDQRIKGKFPSHRIKAPEKKGRSSKMSSGLEVWTPMKYQ